MQRSRCVSHSCRSRSEFARTMKDFFGLLISHANGFSVDGGSSAKECRVTVGLPGVSIGALICISLSGMIFCWEN